MYNKNISINKTELVASWLVMLSTLLAAMLFHKYPPILLAILFTGMLLYKYLRRHIDRRWLSALQIMGFRWKLFSVVYYFVLATATYLLAFLYPDRISYGFWQVVLLVTVFLLPVLPSMVGKEWQLYKQLGQSEN